MTRNDVLRHFARLNVWKRGAERAPHKPLLVLYALGKWANEGSTRLAFREVDEALTTLLKEFGPSRASYHPEYPFWRLQNDGIWNVEAPEGLTGRKGHTDPKKSELLKHDIHAGFSPSVLESLTRDPGLVAEISSQLLESHFPESIHADVLDSVGLSLEGGAERLRRDPRFRVRVLTAYEYRCAVCAYSVRLGSVLLGLDAAHIMWHQAGGPDEETNGLALCVLHHKMFDLGAFTVRPDLTMLVSEDAHGSEDFQHALMRFHGATIRKPQRPEYRPRERYLEWHHRQVFRGRARVLS